jgi:hypothetical protein
VRAAESKGAAIPGACEELCGGGSDWHEGGEVCWQGGGGACAIREIGQVKKKRATFETIRMSFRWDGQECEARA